MAAKDRAADRASRRLPGRILVDAVAFVALLSSAGLLWRSSWLLSAVYIAISLFLLSTRWSPQTVAYYLVGFCLGPVAEFYAVLNGAWQYTGARWVLPLWLPFGWGISAVLLKSVGDFLATALSARVTRPRRRLAAGGRSS